MSWEEQGRQYHGWFGHGTSATDGAPPETGGERMFDPAAIAARIDAIAHAAVAHLPAADRPRANAAFAAQRLAALRTTLTAWSGARGLSETAFAQRFAAPATRGTAIAQLRAAADGARSARTHADLAEASAKLAGAMRGIGLDNWPRILSDAAARAASNGPPDGQTVLAQYTSRNQASDASGRPAPDDFRSRFDAAVAIAYREYSNDCSHYLQEFLKLMGLPDTPYRTANDFLAFVQRPDSGWRQVSAQEAVRLSAAGHIVVAGLAQPGGSGHVAVVGPQTIPATTAGGHPMSPQVFSGSASNWAGSRSQGEHSVADGWPNRELPDITYWVKQ